MDEILALSPEEKELPLLEIIERIIGRERFYEWLAERYPHLPTIATQLQQLRLDQQSIKKKIEMEEQQVLLQECLYLHQALQRFMIHHYQALILYLLLYNWEEWRSCCWRAVMQQSLAESLRVLRYYLERYHKVLTSARQFVLGVIFRLLYLEAMLERQLSAKTQKLVESYGRMLTVLGEMQIPYAAIAKLTQALQKTEHKPASMFVFHEYFLKELATLRQAMPSSMQNRLHGTAVQITALQDLQAEHEVLHKHTQTLVELRAYYDDQRSQCEMDLMNITLQPEQTIDQSHLEIRQLLHKATETSVGSLRLVETAHPADEAALQTIMDDLDRIAEEMEEGGQSVSAKEPTPTHSPERYNPVMLGNA